MIVILFRFKRKCCALNRFTCILYARYIQMQQMGGGGAGGGPPGGMDMDALVSGCG
jgi:hypothetical protein